MSRHTPYQKPNYNVPLQRQKSLSPSPLKFGDRSRLGRSTYKGQLPTTQAKRRNENQQEYMDHIPKSLYTQNAQQSQLKTTKKNSSYLYQPSSPSQASQNKIQILKEQNMCLTQENHQLNDILSDRNQIIKNLQKKLQYQIQQQVTTLEEIQRQKNRFLTQFHMRDSSSQSQIQYLKTKNYELMNEVKSFAQKGIQLQKSKNYQIQLLRQQFHQQNRHLLDNIIVKNQKTIQIKQIQTRQLMNQIQRLNQSLNVMQENYKLDSQDYNLKINQLIQQNQKLHHQKKLQLSQQKMIFQNMIESLNKQKEQKMDNLVFKYEVQIKKIKNMLGQKHLQKGNLQGQIQTAKLQHSNKLQQLLQRQNILKQQIDQLQVFYQTIHKKQMQKQRTINYHQNQLKDNSNAMNISELKNQIDQLLLVNKNKSQQINSLYRQIQKLRNQTNSQIQRISIINDQLKKRISEMTKQNQQQGQMLKIKVSELRHADLSSLKNYYQNQIHIKSQQIIDLQKIVKDNRDKLHKELEQRILQKKKYQYLIDELRIRNAELDLKIAMMAQDHKQSIQNIGSQMEMTSMTLIRQSTQKQKYSHNNELQKKRLQQMILSKENQIEELNNLLKLMKKNHIQQIQQKNFQVNQITQKNDQLNKQINRQRQFYQKQINKKQQMKKQTKQYYQNEISKQKQEFRRQITETVQNKSNENNLLSIQVQRLKAIQKQLRGELAIHAEHNEQRNIQKDITHDQQKSRLAYAKQNLQINLKSYYQKKMSDIIDQLDLTKQQLTQKCTDLRAMTQKYHKLEKKLQKVMESQEKMRVLQERVLCIGQQNNVVKNLSELNKSKRRI